MQKQTETVNAHPSRGLSSLTKYVILFSALLLATNILLGAFVLSQSVSTVRRMVRKSMLNMSNTAASLIDGDLAAGFTEEDIGTEEYEYALSELAAFQNNTDIEYIYMVRQVSDDEFVFILDADPEDPADFGEDVLVTDALRTAAKGTPMVDDEPAQDEWGNFYSSYSPVFDSYGNVAAVVGVDFDADWYDRQILDNSKAIAILSGVSLLLTLLVLLIVTGNIRRKFEALNSDLAVLASDVEELASDLVTDPGYVRPEGTREAEGNELSGDLSAAELEVLSGKIRAMHTDIKSYIDYVHGKALTDALTSIGNTTAYMERTDELDRAIAAGRASFHVAVFDINYLKQINDEYGHMCGDRVIRGAASAIAAVFGVKDTYRIGGDEFIAVAEGLSDEEMAAKLARLDEEVAKYNSENEAAEGELSLSKGLAAYVPGEDENYRSVFSRADRDMYENKAAFHRARGTRSR